MSAAGAAELRVSNRKGIFFFDKEKPLDVSIK